MRILNIVTTLILGAASSLAEAQTVLPDAAVPPGAQGSVIPLLTVPKPPPPEWALHGFADLSIKNDYVTPRGLVVTTSGVAVQVLGGLVAVAPNGIAFTAGTWTDLNPGYSKRSGNISAVNEFDFFFGVSGTVANHWKLGVQYVQFVSGQPSVAFQDEHNLEFSTAYDDSAPGKALTVNPYAKLFWAVDSKSSTVVVGKAGNTFDVELGLAPTLAVAPFTVSVPTWITVGPSSYWGRGKQDFGVASTGLKASLPVTFGSGGKASVYAQAQYYHLINDNLVIAKAILNSGDHKRDQVVFGIGMGVGF